MITLLVLFLVVVVLDLCTMRWGVSSVDGPDSPEWKRRQSWYGFH